MEQPEKPRHWENGFVWWHARTEKDSTVAPSLDSETSLVGSQFLSTSSDSICCRICLITYEGLNNKVQQLVNGVNSHDIAAIIDLYDDDAIVEDPVGTDPKCGHEAIKAFYKQGFQVKIQFELTGPIRCAGNSAAFPFLATIDLGENKTSMEIIEVLEFNEEGKVQLMRAYWGPQNCVQH